MRERASAREWRGETKTALTVPQQLYFYLFLTRTNHQGSNFFSFFLVHRNFAVRAGPLLFYSFYGLPCVFLFAFLDMFHLQRDGSPVLVVLLASKQASLTLVRIRSFRIQHRACEWLFTCGRTRTFHA